MRETWQDATAHAEIVVIQAACKKLKAWRLTGATLYVTIEPCIMCAGALMHARVERVVFGALDPKGGAVRSVYTLFDDGKANHRPLIMQGVLESECREIIGGFFRQKRI